jgi:hypothetical protein
LLSIFAPLRLGDFALNSISFLANQNGFVEVKIYSIPRKSGGQKLFHKSGGLSEHDPQAGGIGRAHPHPHRPIRKFHRFGGRFRVRHAQAHGRKQVAPF